MIIYFYLEKENEIIYTYVSASEKGKTTFAFVCINEGLELGYWKYINKDFDFFENRAKIKMFEDRILKLVKERIASNQSE